MLATALAGGATTALGAAVALFFARYWRDTGDRLFLLFSWAFAILAANRAALTFFADDEIRSYLYWIRLLAYLIILAAILDKNRRGAKASGEYNLAAMRRPGP
jgi:hypothetical protein